MMETLPMFLYWGALWVVGVIVYFILEFLPIAGWARMVSQMVWMGLIILSVFLSVVR